MGVNADIETALFDAVYAMFNDDAVLGAIPYSMPNRVINPPESGRYIRVDLFRNNNRNYAWGNGTVYPGILQLMVVDQVDTGTGETTALCDLIVSYWPKGRELQSGGVRVQIEVEPDVLSPVQDGHKTETPVSIRYRCYA